MFDSMSISHPLARQLTLAGLTFFSIGAFNLAHASEDLARQKACLACHQVKKAVLGPSFSDIAKKYKGNKKAGEQLAQKIRKGGGGVWNMPMGPMPAQGQVSASEAKQLAKWILATK
jgi:cytochrome c